MNDFTPFLVNAPCQPQKKKWKSWKGFLKWILFLWILFFINSCQKASPSVDKTDHSMKQQSVEDWQVIMKNNSLPIEQRLQAWVKYADITSVYNNIYTEQPTEEKKNQLLALLEKISPEDHTSRILSQYLVGEFYWKTGNTKIATNAFSTMEKRVDSLWIDYPDKRMIYHYLGILNGELGNLVVAKDYILKCIQECEQVQDTRLLGLAYWNIAIHYGNLEDYEQENYYLDKAIQIADQLDYAYLRANILSTKGNNYHDRGQLKQAETTYQTTLALCKDPTLEVVRYLTLLNYGNLLLHNKDYERAYDYFKQCKTYFLKIENQFLITSANSQLAGLFLATNQLDGLGQLLEETIQQQKLLGLQNERVASIKHLSFYHNKKRNYRQALKYFQEYHVLENGIINEANLRKMAQSDFKSEQEQHQIEQEKQLLIQKGQWVGLLLLSLCLFFALRAFQIKRKANKEIQIQKEELKQLNIAKDRMLSIIAHDLKKPMISFRGISQKVNYLLAKQDYPRLLALGNNIDKEMSSLNALVDNLLKWAMLQKDILTHTPEEVYLATITDQVFTLFEQPALQKNVTLSKTINAKHKVLVDENILSTILRNLVDNALKFSMPDGTIHIASEEKEGGLYISVKDTGVGIAPEQINQLFLLQKDKSTKGTRGEMGAGLGLHLVKELITLCKGHIEVISQLGQGTSFRFFLPIG